MYAVKKYIYLLLHKFESKSSYFDGNLNLLKYILQFVDHFWRKFHNWLFHQWSYLSYDLGFYSGWRSHGAGAEGRGQDQDHDQRRVQGEVHRRHPLARLQEHHKGTVQDTLSKIMKPIDCVLAFFLTNGYYLNTVWHNIVWTYSCCLKGCYPQ